ncbi:protein trichome berefringence-like 7 [Herrania umbratica]|uniref:Protein trichome berefringence-like 7 n=1 Tax=Herrania umbratica TaxID=108875 RepID=A0A6J1ADM5_9ROSI|nr:protein trichome berefringence-like 7 [Herrania umbratica]XP_021285034.1 protein trichome berefringence-like 7 [Herrania umbratica]XP_021285035.1 protein trichome berefringence-like 7 [Herrania umbratica]XP_021285036.1 protein trichome berefringence-like 7 [Herrania umbratica]
MAGSFEVEQYSLSKLRQFHERFLSFSNKIVKGHCKLWVSESISALVVIGLFLSFLLATVCAYFYVFPRYQPAAVRTYRVHESSNSVGKCNVFEGKWIPDESYPLYNASQCPFAEPGFNCLANGRRDRGYQKWRWKPKNCDIPKFNVQEILGKLHGKRIVFVGDSLSRTQWESMICLLMTGVEDKRDVYEINGNKIAKKIRFLGVWFSSFNLRVDFYRSVFLVQPGPAPRRAPKRVKSTVRLDKLDDISKEWIDSDFLIFNSGHWWTPTKLFDMGCYFQSGGSLKLGMGITSGFRSSLKTWAAWVETSINRNRTRVFFRTFESSHWIGRNRNSCKVTRRPWLKTKGRDRSRISDIIIDVVKKMTTPVAVLHVTPMGAFRSDAHVGAWSDNPSVPDCSHWCLPGVPDTWNEILLSMMLSKNGLTT